MAPGTQGPEHAPIPVILDTDIGTDVDDTWALAFLLRCPELDLKLVTTATGNVEYRARLAARLLECADRTDVPVALGVGAGTGTGTGESSRDQWGPQGPWVADYPLSRYPGPVYRDAAARIVEVARASPDPVTVIGIGPLTNVALALERDPTLAERARFVGMQGSVFRGYHDAPVPAREYNVAHDPAACRAVFEAPWDKLVTPLDTCGVVRLHARRYARLAASRDPLCRAVLENFETWSWMNHVGQYATAPVETSVLFDTVAVVLAFETAFVELATHPLVVTDEGFTRVDETGSAVRCAVAWRDLDGFLELLASRLAVDRPGHSRRPDQPG